MKQELAEKIFKILKTKRRANDFLLLYRSLSVLVHNVGGVEMGKVLTGVFGVNIPDWVNSLMNFLPRLGSGSISEEDVEVLKSVADLISSSVTAKIEMSFEPSEEFLDAALAILRNQSEDETDIHDIHFLIDVSVKEGFEAGALVYLGGKFVDLTLKNHVINYLKKEDVVNRYL